MIITTEMAQPIVDQMIKIIDYNVNIMNQKGVIVASGDKNRIYEIHQGALEAIDLKRERIIHKTDSKNMIGTHSGVNIPIEIKGKVIGAVGITGEPTKIYKFIHIIKITVESLLEQQILIEQLRYKQTALDEWIQNLIDEDSNNIPLLESKAKYLKINFNKYISIFVIEVKYPNILSLDYEEIHKNEIQIIKLLNFFYPNCLFSASIGKGYFILGIPFKENENIKVITKVGCNINTKLNAEGFNSFVGIGNVYKGIIGYRTSYIEGQQSIDLLKQIANNKVVCHIQEWGLLQLVEKIPPETRQSFLSRYLSTKPTLNEELQETLKIFLNNNLNIKSTSDEMHIHRNTLIYRLDKIKELWGLDPRNFNDAIKLQFINWCRTLK
nr:sugar diacid recognition domain-containing protein [Fredinandcohnia onubensis]